MKASQVKVQEGPHCYQLDMEFESYVSQIIKIPKKADTFEDLEIEWVAGPIPIDDDQGKEIIHKVTLENWNNSGIFHTDANGRQNVERIRDQRFDY